MKVSLDRDVKPGESVTHFMESAIRESDFVLIVCTPHYAEKANARLGGVGYETGMVTGELYHSAPKGKFVPLLRSGSLQRSLPSYLSDKLAIDFRLADRYDEGLAVLVEHCGGDTTPPTEAPRPPVVATADPPAKKVRPPLPDLKTSDLRRHLDTDPRPTVVEFWAPWCGPCRVLAPVIEELAAEHSYSTEFVRINVDEERELAAEHEILSIPTILAFRGHTISKKIVGALPKARLLKELEGHIGEPDPAPGEGDDAIALTWHEGRIQAAVLNGDGTYSFISNDDSRLGLIYLPRFVKTAFAEAIAELEELLNDSYATKDDIRNFLKANPNLILGGEYKAAHPQVLLRRDGHQPLRPDFMLEPIAGELADIVEVEPGQRAIASEIDGVTELTDVVLQACARLREYRDHFEEERHRIKIEDEHGIRVFRPRMFIVIGRSGETDSITRRRLEAQLGDIRLRSWDEVLAVAQKTLEG